MENGKAQGNEIKYVSKVVELHRQ